MPAAAYRSIYGSFWTGPTGRAIRAEGLAVRVLAMYLITSPHSTMIGLYYLPLSYICTDTGIGEADVRAGLAVLARLGFARYDETTEWVWVVAAVEWQVNTKSPSQVKGAASLFEASQASPALRHDFWTRYHTTLALAACEAPETIESVETDPHQTLSIPSGEGMPTVTPPSPDPLPTLRGSGRRETGDVKQDPPPARETADETLTADPDRETAVREFVETYRALYREHRNGAVYHVQEARVFPNVWVLVGHYPNAAWLRAMAEFWLRSDLPFARKSTGGIEPFITRAAWCDASLREGGFSPDALPSSAEIGRLAHRDDRVDARAAPAGPAYDGTGGSTDPDWFDECKRLHGLRCNGSGGHRLQMAIDAAARPGAAAHRAEVSA